MLRIMGACLTSMLMEPPPHIGSMITSPSLGAANLVMEF